MPHIHLIRRSYIDWETVHEHYQEPYLDVESVVSDTTVYVDSEWDEESVVSDATNTKLQVFVEIPKGPASSSTKETLKEQVAHQDVSRNTGAMNPPAKEGIALVYPTKSNTLKADTPNGNTPSVDISKSNEQKVDEPKGDTSKVDKPKEDTLKMDAAKMDGSKEDTLKLETPKGNIPKTDAPKVDRLGKRKREEETEDYISFLEKTMAVYKRLWYRVRSNPVALMASQLTVRPSVS